MAVKKSELYNKIWDCCDTLRGSMDPSEYKNYVLVMLFVKYISDKYAGKPYAPIIIPKGASFKDMVALKGQTGIGDAINKKILAPLARENKLQEMPDFNDPAKFGTGKDQIDRITELIAIFEDPLLDFSKNRAEGDDILGDAYEYLMRHFAVDSGKSKGQFYTPAEVSRVIAQILGIRTAQTTSRTTAYDPTCGSGSLLLRLAEEANTSISLYGQEKDGTTSGLAYMNMVLHNMPEAVIEQENTLTTPKFKTDDGKYLKTFDYVVANPPFSDKKWKIGINDTNQFGRFTPYGMPPDKQGDYAFLLHVVASLNKKGEGACILPHGVLFRGNAEAEIRRKLVESGIICGIIGLPPNLFYGTGIPACIVVLDKGNAAVRKGVFLIDASAGFIKDGNKNRLRERDIHRIVDVFTKRQNVEKYSKMVSLEEIEKNDFNLNIPLYIDAQEPEDRQDIEGHLSGGIPACDIDGLQKYWDIYPKLRRKLFKANRSGYVDLAVEQSEIKKTIFEHPEFIAFSDEMGQWFDVWRKKTSAKLKKLEKGFSPKQLILELAEGLLRHYVGKPLLDPYAVYQHLLDYWNTTMQDDCYIIATDGWVAKTERIIEKNKKTNKEVDKGWYCDLVPKEVLVRCYFAEHAEKIEKLQVLREGFEIQKSEMEEEHGGEDGYFAELDSMSQGNIKARIKEIKNDPEAAEELAVLNQYLEACTWESETKKKITAEEKTLDDLVYQKYPKLKEDEVKRLVVDEKWLHVLAEAIHGEMERISQALSRRVRELAERYEKPLPILVDDAKRLEKQVQKHLERMGFTWK